jgi:hypothetical protein
LRKKYGWGSRKIRKLIVQEFGSAPARRTIDRIFERHDLITKKRNQPAKPGHPGKPFTPMDATNAVWTVDFKGQFRMRNGRYDLSAQQRHFNVFRHTFNEIRPHEALDDETPASVYVPSVQPYPETLPPLAYPDHFEVRKVSSNGGIRWHSRWINISSVLASELIGLEPIGPNLWQVYFGPLTLGWFDEESLSLTDYFGNKSRNPIC